MKKEDILVPDWNRLFFGEVPIDFYIEIIFRTGVIYLILMVSMRLMGKKITSQLGRNEMISVISLAAAIGVPLQSPDRGLLAAVVIAFIVVLMQQIIAKLITKSERFETLTQDDTSILVSEGMLNLDAMKRTRLTRERVFGQLRFKGLHQLGEVKRMYLEANGTFTVVKQNEASPGLNILPDWDDEFIKQVCEKTDGLVCSRCGNSGKDSTSECENCGDREWVAAVI